jgi:hypothetical protein
MASGAQLSVTELRRSARHPVHFRVAGEHRRLGDLMIDIANISAHGFMAANTLDLGRGERIIVRLPVAGRLEAHLIWNTGDRAGFQFERIIRLDDFNGMMAAMQPNERLRRER